MSLLSSPIHFVSHVESLSSELGPDFNFSPSNRTIVETVTSVWTSRLMSQEISVFPLD